MSGIVEEVKRLLREREKIPLSERAEAGMEENERQLEKLLEMARSVSSVSEVENGNAELLTQRYSERLGEVFYFDKKGTLVYISESFIKLDREMKEAQKRIDRRNRERYIKKRFAG